MKPTWRQLEWFNFNLLISSQSDRGSRELAYKSVGESNDNNLIGFIASTVERIGERIDRVEERMATREQLDTATTAIRGDIEQTHLRLNTLEHSVSSRFEHVETELSRLRSAVYLLGKDRPEILRLIGHNGS